MTTTAASLLIVDDEELNRDMLGRRLELHGYQIASAEDGLQALEMVSERAFDLILLDKPIDFPVTLARIATHITCDDLPRLRADLAGHRQGLTPQFQNEHRMLHKDETYHGMLSRGVAVQDASGKGWRMAGSQTDITEGKVGDPLTGLPLHRKAAVAVSNRRAPEAAIF